MWLARRYHMQRRLAQWAVKRIQCAIRQMARELRDKWQCKREYCQCAYRGCVQKEKERRRRGGSGSIVYERMAARADKSRHAAMGCGCELWQCAWIAEGKLITHASDSRGVALWQPAGDSGKGHSRPMAVPPCLTEWRGRRVRLTQPREA